MYCSQWIIILDGTAKFKNLLKHLKTFEDLEIICEDLKKRENHQNVLDTQQSINTSHVRMSFMEESSVLSDVEENDIRKLNSGLCIIISQMFFEDQKVSY